MKNLYFFVVGLNFELNLKELASFLESRNVFFELEYKAAPVILLRTEADLQKHNLAEELGGLIKWGILIDKINRPEQLLETTRLNKIFQPLLDSSKKINFGITPYFFTKNLSTLALAVKKYLKSLNLPCRWVTSKEAGLSSVIVQNEILNKNGLELVLIQEKNSFLLGKTLAVQPFAALGYRDRQRPEADPKAGMLPPKLAKIMINLAQADKKGLVLDPFCGQGTVLQELLLAGYKNILGSDISHRAVDAAEKNLEWLMAKFEIKPANFKLFQADIKKISSKIPSNSVNTIIAEAYLGPALTGIEPFKFIKKIKNELEELYSNSFKEFLKILITDGKIVLAIPVFNIKTSLIYLDTKKFLPLRMKRLDSGNLLYQRKNQKVFRQILILQNFGLTN